MGNCTSGLENLCLDGLDGAGFWGVAIEAAVLAYSFVAVAIVADSHLVVSLETLCVRWNVREDVAGASFMAFGSAAPEIMINAIGTIRSLKNPGDSSGDDTALGVGAIIGSGMLAFTVIPGCCGLATKEALALKRRPMGRDVLAYTLALTALYFAIEDGAVQIYESASMVVLYIVYMTIVVCSPGVRQLYRVKYLGRAPRAKVSFVSQQNSSQLEAEPAHVPVAAAALPVAESLPLGGDATLAPLAPLSAIPVQRATAIESSSAAPPVPVLATPLHAADAGTPMWDALPMSPSLPVLSPMELAPVDLGTSLTGGPSEARASASGFRGFCSACASASLKPLLLAFRLTCPECEHDSANAKWYPITLFSSFVWVAFLSTVISAVVAHWGEMLCIPASFLGMYVIAIGAEIPDTIQSVTVAKRGYGSMAVSNTTGSQIINILVGMGVPFLMVNLVGRDVAVSNIDELRAMARFQYINVFVFISLLLLPTVHTWRPGDHSKATLTRQKGIALICTYVIVVVVFAILLFSSREESSGGSSDSACA